MKTTHFKDWAAFEAYLGGLGLFHMNMGLERIGAVLDSLNLRKLPCHTVQVAGTNGKGSTSTFLCSLARSHGQKAALYSSPHFVSLRERLRLFQPGGSPWGEILPEERWLEGAEAVMRAGGDTLTYFELLTVIAAWLIRHEGAALSVLESGLGGTWDATTAIQAELTVFTPIALDHCAVLGSSIAEIARDKAGAMRTGCRAVSSPQTAEARTVLEESARKRGVELSFASLSDLPVEFSDGMALGIKGGHQRVNAALALAAWRLAAKELRLEPQRESEAEGLAQARIPGRMQFIQAAPGLPLPHPPLILDGAHNPHGLAALGHSLARLQTAPAAIIFNCMSDKDTAAILPHLRALATGQVFVPEFKDNPRAMPAAELARMIGLAATPTRDLTEAIRLSALSMNERLPEERNQDIHECRHPLLICGSLYLLGEFFTLYPQYLTKDSA